MLELLLKLLLELLLKLLLNLLLKLLLKLFLKLLLKHSIGEISPSTRERTSISNDDCDCEEPNVEEIKKIKSGLETTDHGQCTVQVCNHHRLG